MEEKNNCTPNTIKRIEWLDIAKGLGVILVILGHLWYRCLFPIVNHIIYSFHMPLFFILSGFVFKKGNSNFSTYIKQKSKRLLLPTLIFFALGVAYLIIISDESFAEIFRKFFFIDGMCPFVSPCWYFIALFQILIVSYFLNIDKSSLIFKIFIAFFTLILGLIIYEYQIFIPFGLNRTIIAFVFFVAGVILGHVYRRKINIQKTHLKILILSLCATLWILCGIVLNDKISFYNMKLDNYLLFVTAGVCGSIVFIKLCHLLQKTKIKEFLTTTGKNSILIIGTHYFVKKVFEIIMSRLNLFFTWQYCLIVLGFTLFIVIIYNKVGVFFKKYFPAITGDLK